MTTMKGLILFHEKDELMTFNFSPVMIFIVIVTTVPLMASAAPVRIGAATASPGSAILELQADELVTMTPIPFRLLIRDAADRPLRGAKVSCAMTMPSMAMPENRPKVTERDGAYTGEMIFTCAMGAWRIDCLAEETSGSRQTMTFNIDKVRMK